MGDIHGIRCWYHVSLRILSSQFLDHPNGYVIEINSLSLKGGCFMFISDRFNRYLHSMVCFDTISQEIIQFLKL
jgi:hypothetical protein